MLAATSWICICLSGCTSSPWAVSKPIAAEPSPASDSGKATAAQPTAHCDSAPAQTGTDKMQAVMSEVQRIGAEDLAARDRLLEDLRRSDPAIWPLVVEQARTTLAYRRRALSDAKPRPAVASDAMDTKLRPAVTPNVADAPTYGVDAIAGSNDMRPLPPVTPNRGDPAISRLPAPEGPAQAVQTTYNVPMPDDWRQRLTAAIAALEAEVPPSPTTPADFVEHARLRLLYAAAGRREDAARPIPGAPPEMQQFLLKEIEGISAWLAAEQTPDPAKRAADAKAAIAEALAKLAEAAPLAIHNLTFCTEVLSYGCLKPFEKYEFTPNQEVLLYAEIENFHSQKTPKGFHTSLRSSYQILNSEGQWVVDHTFPPTEENCRNLRRDYFIGYHLRLPKTMQRGKYTLRLVVEDTQSRKVGQASVEFSVGEAKPAKKEGGKGKGEGGTAPAEVPRPKT
jgi:hypothetical protein